jgi:hypothetical protein
MAGGFFTHPMAGRGISCEEIAVPVGVEMSGSPAWRFGGRRGNKRRGSDDLENATSESLVVPDARIAMQVGWSASISGTGRGASGNQMIHQQVVEMIRGGAPGEGIHLLAADRTRTPEDDVLSA